MKLNFVSSTIKIKISRWPTSVHLWKPRILARQSGTSLRFMVPVRVHRSSWVFVVGVRSNHSMSTVKKRSSKSNRFLSPTMRIFKKTCWNLMRKETNSYKKTAGDFECTMPPDLQIFADHCGPRQTMPWETIKQGLLQPQGELYPNQTIFNHRSWDQLIEFHMSFYETISSEYLVQGNFKHTQFSPEHLRW